MQDAWRAYLEMALGLTQAQRRKAQKIAGELVNRGGATAAQVQGLVEELLSTGMANREALTKIVRYEVDRALGVVGLATAEEVADLTARVRDLEKQLRAAQARASAAESATPDTTAPAAKRAPAAKGAAASAAKGAAAPAPAAKKAVAEPAVKTAAAPKPAAKKAVAKKAVAKKAVAKKPVATKAVATKPAASRTAAKKAAGTTPPEVGR